MESVQSVFVVCYGGSILFQKCSISSISDSAALPRQLGHPAAASTELQATSQADILLNVQFIALVNSLVRSSQDRNTEIGTHRHTGHKNETVPYVILSVLAVSFPGYYR